MNAPRTRAAGVLLPVSALPSAYGIGTFGPAARRWIDFLSRAGHSVWQVLPLGPTGYGDSPYQSPSAFALNPYFVDLELLCRQGLLRKEDCTAVDWGFPGQVGYEALLRHRHRLLLQAFQAFDDKAALDAFRSEHADWLEDYALFMAIKQAQNDLPWTQWPAGLRLRKPRAIVAARKEQKTQVDYHIFVQYQAYSQWMRLKRHAFKRGVRILGDAPIYVAMDSADAWAHPELFQLNKSGRPTRVAGCPPDYFSPTGQLWGNPLYRWEAHEQTGYAWWTRRIQASLTLVDLLRIDHFRGFASYYAIPAAHKTAMRGDWVKGPGSGLFSAVEQALGRPALIAEDLGYLTPDVFELMRETGYPGMKVLQFAFDSGNESAYLPHCYERNCVVYTGTHDNDTTMGWARSASKQASSLARDYAGPEFDVSASSALIRAAMTSVADLAVIPLQDYLGLDSDARMNTPSTIGGQNWRWRVKKQALTPKLAERMRRMAYASGRCGE